MPMNWTAEAEAKLFAAIIEAADIKFSQDLLDRLAKVMGPECTPKAIRHRIDSVKKRAPKSSNPTSTSPTKGTTAAAAAAPKPKPSPRSRKPRSSTAAPAASTRSPPDDDEAAPITPKGSRKRAANGSAGANANANANASGAAKRARRSSTPVEETLAAYEDGLRYDQLYGSGAEEREERKWVKREPSAEFEGLYDDEEDRALLEYDGAREVV
ncbi:hypothetical protein V2W45_1334008 [Cenococcum geophilum]